MMKYAAEGAEITRQQTLAITPNFHPETRDHPMTMYDKFSRLAIAILGESGANSQPGEGKRPSVTCNVTIKKLTDIMDRTLALLEENDRQGAKTTEKKEKQEKLSPAYTVKIKAGLDVIKGKTPAEAFAQTEPNHEAQQNLYTIFKKQIEYFEQNTRPGSRFEKSNREQIAALQDAMNLMQKGQFDTGKVVQRKFQVCDEMTAGPNELYENGQPTGLYKYTNLIISVEMGEDTPVVVTITNGKIRKAPNGDWSLKNMVDKKIITMRIYAFEWRYLRKQVMSMMRCFEDTYYPMARKLALREQVVNDATRWQAMQALKQQYAAFMHSEAQAALTFYSQVYTAIYGIEPERNRVLVKKKDIEDLCGTMFDRKLFDVVIHELKGENMGITYFSPAKFPDKQPKQTAEYIVNIDKIEEYLAK